MRVSSYPHVIHARQFPGDVRGSGSADGRFFSDGDVESQQCEAIHYVKKASIKRIQGWKRCPESRRQIKNTQTSSDIQKNQNFPIAQRFANGCLAPSAAIISFDMLKPLLCIWLSSAGGMDGIDSHVSWIFARLWYPETRCAAACSALFTPLEPYLHQSGWFTSTLMPAAAAGQNYEKPQLHPIMSSSGNGTGWGGTSSSGPRNNSSTQVAFMTGDEFRERCFFAA